MYINNPGHMTKMATGNWFTDFNETWHEASMTQVLHSMYKS